MKHLRPAGLRLAFSALALLLICFAPTLAQTPPATPLTGKVAHITILGTKNIPADTVRAVLTLKVGDAYTPQAAAKDAAALEAIGVFNGEVNFAAKQTSPNSVDVTYTVSENPIVSSIKFTANTPNRQPSVPAADLIAQMKTQTGQVLNTNTLVGDIKTLFSYVTGQFGYVTKLGYLMDVSSDINIDSKTGILTIPLVECYIKSITITGNSRIKTADILAQMHTKTGDIFSSAGLLQDASTLYETGQIRTVNYNWNITKPGEIALTGSLVEQAVATGILDEKRGKIIPFLYDSQTGLYPIVQVSVNGHAPLPFLLDTGSTPPLSLNLWAAKELGLNVTGKTESENGFTFTRVSINGVVLQGQSQSNNAVFDTKETWVLDLSLLDRLIPTPHVAGIVGLGMLARVTSHFDFVAKTLTIYTYQHPPLRIPGGTVLPLRGTPTGNFTVRANLAPETYADLIIDTGNNSTQLPLSALSVLHPTAICFNSYQQRIDSMYTSPEIRLPSLLIGTLRVPNVEAGTLPPSTRLSLGLDILADYRLTLDAPNGQLIMEPTVMGERYPRGRSRLNIKPVGNGWAISDLSAESPARTAGLRSGDQLITVAGTSVQGLSDAQVGKLFAVRLGTTLRVLVQRDGKEIALSWLPADDFAALPTAIDGLPMQKAPGGPWVISEAMKGYPGDKAGLLAGDTLTKMDNEATANMSLARFVELVKKPSVLVEVERAGVAKPFMVRLSVPK